MKGLIIVLGIVIVVLFIVTVTDLLPRNINQRTPHAKAEIELIAQGLTAPVDLAFPDDGTERLFIVDQIGIIKIIDSNGNMLETPFLDIRDRMVSLDSQYDERGLLGLAFHPDYKINGRFFVYYSAQLDSQAPQEWNHTSIISEFTVSENKNVADDESEKVILRINQPQSNHNGGDIAFGPDGYLYIPLGDGGGANDIGVGHSDQGNGQNIHSLLGSILRIDVDTTALYEIPGDNPFINSSGRDEIFAYGFRNPFRLSFDVETGNLFVGDVGQNLWEEIDIVQKGNNYGWNIMEGKHCFDPNNPSTSPSNCSDTGPMGRPLSKPILEYKNANVPGGIGRAVIGGFVYRGNNISQFVGNYIFGDWSNSFTTGNGSLFIGVQKNSGEWEMLEIEILSSQNGRLNEFLLSLGQDHNNELYILTSSSTGPSGSSGKVYKIISGSFGS